MNTSVGKVSGYKVVILSQAVGGNSTYLPIHVSRFGAYCSK